MQFKDRINKLFRVDLDAIQPHGKTRLQDAIDGGNLSRVKSLIEAGANPDNAGNLVHPPLHQAILRGEATIAHYLLSEAKVDLNRLDFKGDPALKLAVTKGDWFIAKEMLARKADPNIADSEGRSPLFHVSKTDVTVLELLLSNGADVNHRDQKGNTPLHHSAAHPEIVKALLAAGANPAILNNEKRAAAHIVLENNPSSGEIVAALSRSTGGLSTVNQDGKNCLHFLACGSNPKAVEYVLQQDPDLINSADYKGRTPMMALLDASWVGQMPKERQEIISILLKAGADPNTHNGEGETLLHIAASSNNNIDVIIALAKHKANLDARTDKGKTAVHIAAEKKLIDTLDVLLDMGADPNIKDERGWTLLDQLARSGDRDSMIVQRLIAGGGVYNKLLPQYPDFMKPAQPQQPAVIDRKKTGFDKFGPGKTS